MVDAKREQGEGASRSGGPAGLPQGLTLQQATRFLQDALQAAGDQNPSNSARWLVQGVLGLSATDLVVRSDCDLALEDAAALERALQRRCAGEPLQYITGHAPFRYVDLEARPGVFIPRPETEVLVDRALQELDELQRAGVQQPLVADLCCGSGTIAVSIAVECPAAQVLAVDVSGGAVELTRRNASRLGVQDRVTVLQGDLAAPLAQVLDGRMLDMLVSNPPYIPTQKLSRVPAEVMEWEPLLALDGGEDGLDTFRRILQAVPQVLEPGGLLLCELDEDTLEDAARLCREGFGGAAYDEVRVIDDLTRRNRVLEARRSR